ncbi:MAG: HAMP domain-containing histidine kinase [Fibrobacteria bacterium]|nr:HAMP domain-containing histidine kinase [Fibrobacteria bacterium]
MKTSDLVDLRVLELEARLKEAEERWHEAEDRLRRQEEFFQMAVHDLRSPLSAIVVYAELLMNKVMGDLDDRQLEPIRTIHRNCTSLIRMAEDVLTSARVRAGSVRPRLREIDIALVVDEATKSLQGLAEAKLVRFHVEALDQPVAIPVDADLLARAFANVLGNAIKFSPHGGEIRIGFEVEEGELRVSFADEGPGISPEKRVAIFEKFRRGDTGEQAGHGLGLAIAKFFIELHGGRILVEGVRGRGSTFLVGLPLGG